MIYDSAQNLTWLQDANGGRVSWDNATTWVNNLSYGGYTDWRLPIMVDTGTPGCNNVYNYNGTDCGFNVDTATSELAYMYDVILGNTPYYDTSGRRAPGWNHTPNSTADGVTIANLQASHYWLYAPNTDSVWFFSTNYGAQALTDKSYAWYVWAVRSGDVGAPTNVPEPSALALLGLGLVGMIAARRRC